MKKELTYSEKLYEYLDRMPACTIKISKICKPENLEKFKKTVMKYIDEHSGENGFELEFTNDWQAINKFDVILK